jgi:hypothetical protein
MSVKYYRKSVASNALSELSITSQMFSLELWVTSHVVNIFNFVCKLNKNIILKYKNQMELSCYLHFNFVT